MIQVSNLTKRYHGPLGEVRALDQVDFHAQAGELVCIKGPSGCGKSTLLFILGGLLHPSSGHVQVADQALYSLSTRQRERFRARTVGFVFQMFHLVPYLSVLENIQLHRPLGSRAEAASWVERVGLSDRQWHKPMALSAGEKQRTALARAMLNRPPILLCDEPSGNLDPANAASVFTLLRQYRDEGGCVVVATHAADADQYADRIVQLDRGKLALATV